MPVWLAVILVLLSLSASACAVYYTVVVARVIAGSRRVPTLREVSAETPDNAETPPLCVIVPAHNEEDSIKRLAESLRDHDYAPLRVVFALDRCTDQTERVLLDTIGDDARFEILNIDHCPPDWAGKVHAMHSAFTHAEGPPSAELLLFLDADTWLEDGALRAAAHHLRDQRLDLLSLLPTLTADDAWEKHAQPACGFELVRQYPLDAVNRDTKRRAFANGQFMLFTRRGYLDLGTHAAVKDELLEDIAIARLLVDRMHRRVGCLMADGLVRCKMYGSWPQFRRGWKRIFTEAARRNPARLRKHARRSLLAGVGLPGDAFLCLALAGVCAAIWPSDAIALITLGLGLAGTGAFLLAIGAIYQKQRVPIRCAPTYPLAAWRTARILLDAANDLDLGRATVWAGRSYERRARTPESDHASLREGPTP